MRPKIHHPARRTPRPWRQSNRKKAIVTRKTSKNKSQNHEISEFEIQNHNTSENIGPEGTKTKHQPSVTKESNHNQPNDQNHNQPNDQGSHNRWRTTLSAAWRNRSEIVGTTIGVAALSGLALSGLDAWQQSKDDVLFGGPDLTPVVETAFGS